MWWGGTLAGLGFAGPAWAECTAPGCHDDLFTALVLLAVGLVLTLGLAIAGTIWLVRRRRGGLALLGWFALFALLLTLAQL